MARRRLRFCTLSSVTWRLLLTGETVTDRSSVISLNRRLVQIKNNNTAKGALDMALHQALCVSRGESLRDYLWASRERLRLSAIVSTGEPAAVLRRCRILVSTGAAGLQGQDRAARAGGNRDDRRPYRKLSRRPIFTSMANETLDDGDALAILLRLQALGVMYCEEGNAGLAVAQAAENFGGIARCRSSPMTRPSRLYDLYREAQLREPSTSSISRRRGPVIRSLAAHAR